MKNPRHTELSEWDLLLLKQYPLTCVLADYMNEFDNATDWCYNNCVDGTYTWKGDRFFFKDEQQFLLFSLKFS